MLAKVNKFSVADIDLFILDAYILKFKFKNLDTIRFRLFYFLTCAGSWGIIGYDKRGNLKAKND